MYQPQRREAFKYIHIDSRDLQSTNSIYDINASHHLQQNDYNNIKSIELKVFSGKKPSNEDYVFFKIKNIKTNVDSTSNQPDITYICFFDDPNTKKPIFFGGNKFNEDPPIAKLGNLKIEILKRNGLNNYEPITFDVNDPDDYQSFVLKICYYEGNLY